MRRKIVRLISVIFSLTLALAMPALAQFGNPAGDDPATRQNPGGVPAAGANDTNVQDRLFAKLITAGGMAEVELAKIAGEQAQNARVKQFAKQMSDDHGKANQQFSELGKRLKLVLPAQLDPDHQAAMAELARTGKSEFDLAYMRLQVVDHQKTMLVLEWEIGMGENADVQRFASETLPVVAQHLQIAQNIVTDLSGAAPQGAAAETTGSHGDPGGR